MEYLASRPVVRLIGVVIMKKLLTVVSILCVLPFSTSALAQVRASQPLPDGPGKALVENVCSSCHSVATITRAVGYSTAQQVA